MPRMTVLRFLKDYETVAEGLKTMFNNPILTEREEDGKKMIDLEGDFQHFMLDEMEMWGGHFKVTIIDNRIADAADRESRAFFAEHVPGFGDVLFSPTIAHVYKRVEYKIVTTIVTERLEDDAIPVVLSREATESEVQTEWKEITREFGQKVRIQK